MNKLLRAFIFRGYLLGTTLFFMAFSSAFAQVSITCPGDIEVENDFGECAAIVTYSPPVGTGSGTGITTVLTEGLPSGASFDVGTTAVTYTVTNNEGDSDECTFFVTVNDTEVPIITCPEDITVDADPGTCSAIVNFDLPTAVDNCGIFSVFQFGGLPSGSNFPVGVSFLDFQAVDINGNSAFCRFKISVNDVTNPTISCPPLMTFYVYNTCDTVINYTPPVGVDACTISNTFLTSGIGSGGTFSVGTSFENYTVVDLAGNSASCGFNVKIIDGSPPVITCPADITVNAVPGNCSELVSYGIPTVSDNCPSVSLIRTAGPASGSLFPAGTTTVEYTATDISGNQSSCSFDVTVIENVDPSITCISNISVNNDAGICGAIVTYTPPEGTDNCSGSTTTLSSGIGSGNLFPLGTTTETYTVTDASGNTAFCSFDVEVIDAENPVITCLGDTTVANDPGECGAVVNFADATATDNCALASTVQTNGPASGSTFPVGTTSVEYTATDDAGNSSNCTFNIIVEDTEAPQIICAGDFTYTIPNGDCSGILTYPDPTLSDNCPGTTFTVISGPASGDVVFSGFYTIELQAEDAAGNTAICSFLATVDETSIPVFDCPGDMSVPSDPGLCSAVVTFTLPTATDSCSAVTVAQTGGPTSGSAFPEGTTSVEFTATDDFGNTSTCSYNITVNDEEAPEISCPGDITVPNDPGECGALVSFTDATATDNCSLASIAQTDGPLSGSVFPVGTTSVEYTAEDAAGNTATCSFNVIVNDTEDPLITCPADVNLTIPGGACSGVLNYPDPIISDNCPGITFTAISGPESGDVVPAGVYTIQLQAEDAAGNTANCSFVATVSENSLPVIDCPANLSVPADAGTCSAVVTFAIPTATDSCSSVTVDQTSGPTTGSTFPAGPTTVEFTATDAFGNTSTCSYVITVVDELDPEITCPGDIAIDTDPGVCDAIVTYDAPIVSDNCSVASVIMTEGLASGSTFPSGETTVTYLVTDISGNTATCSFTVTVTDNEDPQVICPSDITVNIPDGDCEAVVNYALPTATDNCGIDAVNLIEGLASGGTFPTGATTITYEAVDPSGNIDSCSFTVSVIETVPPEITCPADISQPAEDGICGAAVNYIAPIGTDACPGAITILESGLGSGAIFPVGISTETYTVTDASGNSVSCSFTVTISDEQAPIISCPDDIAVDADAGLCSTVVNFNAPTVTDNCDATVTPLQTAGLASGSAFPAGTTTITYSATDIAGNESTCSFDIVVDDTEAPDITCPGDIVLDAASGDCTTIVTYADPVATDNCSGVSYALIDGPASGTEFPVGITTVTYEATDGAGNTSECSFTVTVNEDVPPTIDCPANISVGNDAGICGATVNYTAPVGMDNCGDATTELIDGPAPGSLFPVGTTTVTYQVTDISGNQASCSFDVTVTDTELPVFDCPGDQTIEAVGGLCGVVYDFELPSASDNCTDNLIVTQTGGPASGEILPLGDTSFEFTTTDSTGNIATCGYVLTVEDTTAPIFEICPADTVLAVDENSCEALISFAVPLATDNCDFTLTQTDGPANNGSQAPGTYFFEYTATDISNNASICSFTVTVVDTIAPVIDCPEAFETCSQTPEFELPEVSDNCAVVDIVQTGGPTSGSTFPVGVTTLEFTATDVYGNITACILEITVLENAPRIDLGPDQNICGETSTILSGAEGGGSSPMWSQISGNGNITTPNSIQTEVSNLSTGENTFVYSLDPENGCDIKTDTIMVTVEPGVTVEAGDDQLILNGVNVTLNVQVTPPGGDILWTPETALSCITCTNPVASPLVNTLYFVTYTSELGCEVSDSVMVRVFDKLPNTITPNGDGTNDVWNIPGIDKYPNVVVIIYNRWGNEIFQSTGYNDPWDGTRDGKELPTASYYYLIDYKTSGKENLNGTVNIIR